MEILKSSFVVDENVEQYVVSQFPESSNKVQCASKTCKNAYFFVEILDFKTSEDDVPIM